MRVSEASSELCGYLVRISERMICITTAYADYVDAFVTAINPLGISVA